MALYEHTQPGTVLRWILGLLIVASLISAFVFGTKDVKTVTFFVLPLLSGILTLFWSLTITVTETHLSHVFNLNFWNRSYAFTDIERVTKVKNSWLYGYGMRYIGSGWLYNVSGTDAILIEFKDGTLVRLGTDDQENLYTVLSQQLEE